MFKTNKHRINVWTSDLNLKQIGGLEVSLLSFHIAGSVLQLHVPTEFQRAGPGEGERPGQTSALVGFSCCV